MAKAISRIKYENVRTADISLMLSHGLVRLRGKQYELTPVACKMLVECLGITFPNTMAMVHLQHNQINEIMRNQHDSLEIGIHGDRVEAVLLKKATA